MQIQQGLQPAALSHVDDSLIPKTAMSTDAYQNVRVIRQPTDLVNPTGSGRKITFSLPNSGLLNLRDLEITAELILTGSDQAPIPFIQPKDEKGKDIGVWKWDGTGTDPDPSFPTDATNQTVYFNNINPALSDPFFFTLIERVVVQTGGTPIIDMRELNLVNHHQMKISWDSKALRKRYSTYHGYTADNGDRISGVPYSGYWEDLPRLVGPEQGSYNDRPLKSQPQMVCIRPFMYHKALFNTSDGVFPTQFMPNITIEVWFADPGMVLSQAMPSNYSYRGYATSLSGRLHYLLQNVRLEVVMAGSSTLERALTTQGMSMTFQNFTVFTRTLTDTKGNMSFQIPVTQRAVEKVFLIFRRATDLNDLTKRGKLSAYQPSSRLVQSGNIRINGIRRYGEDLDSRGFYCELLRLYPQAGGSELFQDEFRDWNGANQYLCFSSQQDYSQVLLSGIKTASQTSPLIVDLKFVPGLQDVSGLPIQVDIIVEHTKWLGISRESIEVIE